MTTASWRQVSLGDAVDLISGATPKGVPDHLIEGSVEPGIIPFFKVGDMNLDATRLTAARVSIRPDVADRLKMRIVPAGAIVFPKAGGAIATNKKRIVTRSGAIDLNCMAAVPGPSVDPGYLRLWFESLDLSKLSDGSVLPQLSKKTMARLLLPLPDMAEQRRIVEILEDHLSRLDSALADLRQGKAKLALMRLSSLRRERRSLESEGVPVSRIRDVCETALGKMLDAQRAKGTPTPYLRNINVRWGFVDLADVLTVQLTDEERDRFALRDGDVLVCEGGEPGRCAVWRGNSAEMTFQKALHRVRPMEGLAPEFVAVMLEEFVRGGRAARLLAGTTIKHLPQEKLREITIPVPDSDRQSRTLGTLAELDQAIFQALNELNLAQARARGLRRSLLQAAFSGRLTGEASDLRK